MLFTPGWEDLPFLPCSASPGGQCQDQSQDSVSPLVLVTHGPCHPVTTVALLVTAQVLMGPTASPPSCLPPPSPRWRGRGRVGMSPGTGIPPPWAPGAAQSQALPPSRLPLPPHPLPGPGAGSPEDTMPYSWQLQADGACPSRTCPSQSRWPWQCHQQGGRGAVRAAGAFHREGISGRRMPSLSLQPQPCRT